MKRAPKKSTISCLLAAVGIGIGTLLNAGNAAAAPVILPAPDCGLTSDKNCLVFDQGIVFSLPVLQEYQKSFGLYDGYQFVAKPNEALLFVTQFSGSATKFQGKGTLIDDPYDAMTGGAGSNNLRSLYASAKDGGQFAVPSDPAGGPGGNDNKLQAGSVVLNSATYATQAEFDAKDFGGGCGANMNGCLPLWDADVGALRTLLNANDSELMFFFGFNETGNKGNLDGQDLTAWARVTLHNPDTGASKTFTVSGNNVAYPFAQSKPQQLDVDDTLPTANDLWAYVHSEVCIDDDLASPTYGEAWVGPCNDPNPLKPFPGGKTVNQSLGADEATFAVFNPELSALVKDPQSGYTVLTVDLRMAHLNNGGERLWIQAVSITDTPPPSVPEPGTLGLLGVSLAGLGLAKWRRRRGAFS